MIIIDVSDEVLMWVNQTYGMSQIVLKINSFGINNFYYLALTKNGELNRKNNETYDLQCTNSKIIMMKTIIIDHMRMNCSMNM